MPRGKFGANMSFFKKRILITGIDGLVGSHLTEELIREGAIIAGLVYIPNEQSIFYERNLTKNVTIYHGDLRNFQEVDTAIKDFKPEIIFHLGAQTIVRDALLDPMWTFETNIQGTWNVLESARKQDLPLESILHPATKHMEHPQHCLISKIFQFRVKDPTMFLNLAQI
jgi:CDP-glucose 4,6-dehydratase